MKSIIQERSGKWCSKRVSSLVFCVASVGLAFCYLFADVDIERAKNMPEVIITFAILSGGTHYMTTKKHEE